MKTWIRRIQAACVIGATPIAAIAASCMVAVNNNDQPCQTDCSSFIFCPIFGECLTAKRGHENCMGVLEMVRCQYHTGGYSVPPGCCTGGVPVVPPVYSGGEHPAFIAVPIGMPCGPGEG